MVWILKKCECHKKRIFLDLKRLNGHDNQIQCMIFDKFVDPVLNNSVVLVLNFPNVTFVFWLGRRILKYLGVTMTKF